MIFNTNYISKSIYLIEIISTKSKYKKKLYILLLIEIKIKIILMKENIKKMLLTPFKNLKNT